MYVISIYCTVCPNKSVAQYVAAVNVPLIKYPSLRVPHPVGGLELVRIRWLSLLGRVAT